MVAWYMQPYKRGKQLLFKKMDFPYVRWEELPKEQVENVGKYCMTSCD